MHKPLITNMDLSGMTVEDYLHRVFYPFLLNKFVMDPSMLELDPTACDAFKSQGNVARGHVKQHTESYGPLKVPYIGLDLDHKDQMGKPYGRVA